MPAGKKGAKEDDMTWVFDSLVDFLRGPIWNIPILTFIEQKSMIFEPDGKNVQEYKDVHDHYKNLVDFMLGSYMEDIGITPEQFKNACSRKSARISTRFEKMLFEQLWAADDFDMFQRMMIRTNIELQLQALELLQRRYGLVPASFVPAKGEVSEEERRVLAEVVRQSLQDAPDGDAARLEKAIASCGTEKQRLEEEKRREDELIRKTLKLSLEDAGPNAAPKASGPPISSEEVAKRQEYLRQQRDKLLDLKRIERQKLLDTAEKETAKNRPKTSRAARSAFAGNVDKNTLEMRKHLAEALRREVVNQK